MQPYFFPYIGYFQLISSVDVFIIYNNVQFIKRGWINRNRIKLENKIINITLPLARDSSVLNIDQRIISETWPLSRKKIIRRIEYSYRKTKFFKNVFEIITEILNYEDQRLDKFLTHSITEINKYLGIKTKIIFSSELENNSVMHKGEKRILGLVKKSRGNVYINPIGGIDLYDKQTFTDNGIKLKFLSSNIAESNNENNVSNLSIIDILMNNPIEDIRQMLNDYKLL